MRVKALEKVNLAAISLNKSLIKNTTMTDKRATDQEFLEFAVKALVDSPEDVKVERKIDEMGVLITLDVNPKDMGMVIGREGQTAKALRTILRVIGARNNARVNLKINEPAGSTKGQQQQESRKSIDDVMGDLSI